MLIDWFTVGAQALNFLILVWLLKRYLYKPILDAIDAREKRIAKELADADAKKAEAKRESDEYKHKNDEFDQQRAALLHKATDEVRAERQRMLGEARQAADALSAKRQETLREDARNLSKAISSRTQQEVFAITRKALTDLTTTSLEERLSEVFIRRLREMDDKAKAILGEALKTSAEPAHLRSAFELPAEQRITIQNALNETYSAEVHVRFETAPDLVCGIELTTNGQKIAWSISDYLDSMEKGVAELLKNKDNSEAQASNSSLLKSNIGKRAYELYEEHGHQDGHADQDWEKAEREIGDKMLHPAQSKPALVVKTKPKHKSDPKPKPKIKPKPVTKNP